MADPIDFYGKGLNDGQAAFGAWYERQVAKPILDEKHVRQYVEELILYPEAVKDWTAGNIREYYEGFADGCVWMWRNVIQAEKKVDDDENGELDTTLEDIP